MIFSKLIKVKNCIGVSLWGSYKKIITISCSLKNKSTIEQELYISKVIYRVVTLFFDIDHFYRIFD